jgi:hypothetical protein
MWALLCFAQQRRKAKIRRDAAGKEAGCFHSLGFLRSKNPRLKNGMDAVFEQRKG